MNDESESKTTELNSSQLSHGKRIAVTTLCIVASILTVVAVFDIWIDRQALNSRNWTTTSSKLLENEKVREAVSNYLVTQLYENVDVEAEVRKIMPKDVKPLAGPAASGLKQLALKGADEALQTSQVQDIWEQANLNAHKVLLQILAGGNGALSTQGGVVTLDLRSIVTQLAEQVGIGGDVSSKLPQDAGKLVVLRSNQLKLAQNIATTISGLAVLLTLLVIALFALAIWLAKGRRRKTLIGSGVGIAIAGLVVLVLRNLAGGAIVDALAPTAAIHPAALATWSISSSLLVGIAAATILFGILFICAAAVAGPSRPAIALRHSIAPYMRERPGLVYGVVLTVFMLILLWGPLPATRQIVSVLILCGLLILGVELLRRETIKEFPDAGMGDNAQWALARWEKLREHMGRRGASMKSAATDLRDRRGSGSGSDKSAAAADDRLDRLERLAALKERGLLTDSEFEAQKNDILGQ